MAEELDIIAISETEAASYPQDESIEDTESDAPFSEKDQKAVLSHLDTELQTAKRNHKNVEEDFDVYYKMLHCIRNKKPNEWEPDISLPEFSSRVLTLLGNFSAQYFSSTDYVETDISSDDPKDVAEAKAAKNLLNTLLKDPDAYYYHKVIRLIMFVLLCGYGVIKGGYQQSTKKVLSHYNKKSEMVIDPLEGRPLADDGTIWSDPFTQRPAYKTIDEPFYTENVEVDKPVFDVYPNQNVYMSPEYCYSLNEKEYVIFEAERKLSDLKAEAESMGYFNLDLLDKIDPSGKLGEKTYNKDGQNEEQPQPVDKTFVLYERWGKYPVRSGELGVVPAIDDQGKFEKGAELKECIIHYAQEGYHDAPIHIIGFRESEHSRRPMVRFLCYVDLVNDNGFGDGAVNRELQVATDDNYNLMNYRTRLAVTPAFKGKRQYGLPNKVRISPENVTLLENMGDLEQWVINDNIQGGIFHHNLLGSRMDYAMATSPQTMGSSPERAETATIGSIMESRTTVRLGMKSMNLEFIGFDEFYRMLLTLCNDFMLPQTLENLLGKEMALAYNPKRKDKFRPVSQALETEHSKQFKIKTFQSLYQIAAQVPNPKTAMTMNYIMGQILELMGGDFKVYKKFMLEEDPSTMLLYQLATGAKGMGTPPMTNPMTPEQNQQGMSQPPAEQQTRAMAPGQ